MLSSNKLPELGGETRNVTVFFSDIEGFSLIAEKMSPDSLMELMNEYLSAMTDVIERHGGYVDKYIGDSIVAVFGAPADDPDHAANAARAALDCCTQLAELNASSAALPRIQAGAADRHQFRRGAGRQFRIAAALQLLGHERRGEPGVAAGGRQQILRHHRHRFRDHRRPHRRCLRLARTRRHQGQGANPGAEDLRIAGAVGRADVRAGRHRSPTTPTGLRTGAPANSSAPRSISAVRPTSTGRHRCFATRARELAQNPPGEDWDPIRTLQEK